MRELVRAANKASSSELSDSCFSLLKNSDHSFRVRCNNELEEEERGDIWRIFEENMRELYSASSFGWDPSAKRKELFHRCSRYVLVNDKSAAHKLLAFTMFRFEYEDQENILYCYDLQIPKEARRSGLGKQLMKVLERIAQYWKMNKTMLTVFKANLPALKFYEAVDFVIDPSSPSQYKVEEDSDQESSYYDADYEILSKSCG